MVDIVDEALVQGGDDAFKTSSHKDTLGNFLKTYFDDNNKRRIKI